MGRSFPSMKRRDLFRLLALSALGAGHGLSGDAHTTASNPSPQRDLFSVGKTKNYGNGLKVTFLEVKKDTRCPQGIKCDTPGDAIAVLKIKVGTQIAKNYQLHTNRLPNKVTIPGDPDLKGGPKSFVIKLISLSPERFSFVVKIPQSDYRLDLQANALY